jgi:putative two-component system response regulator
VSFAGSALGWSGDIERVLIVDDEEPVRVMIARMVASGGEWECETAADAAEARVLLARDEFSVVICDVNMPGESGTDLTRWIREHHSDVAVLMATGIDDPELAQSVLELGAYGYLVKPFKRHEVQINVANALGRRRLELENRDHRALLEQRVEERTQELRRSREETIRRLSLAIEFRSRETGEHVERIGNGAALIARRLRLDPGRCELIRLAAPLHDVGKIGISDEILLKSAALTDAERTRMEGHAEIGYRLLTGSGSDLLETAATIAWTHHECWDGSGYPRRLSGEAIPIEGRITAVMDVFDALTHDRVYRQAMPHATALEMIRMGRGTQFDPVVLDAFLDTLGELLALGNTSSGEALFGPALRAAAAASAPVPSGDGAAVHAEPERGAGLPHPD